jgi:16S rRNA G1207 methylase RsmC
LSHDLTLKTRWGVFSPRSIDDGTLLLMKYLKVGEADKCLDLGCGYGPIGLAVAKSCPKGEVHMVDNDFIAVETAWTRNAFFVMSVLLINIGNRIATGVALVILPLL